VIEKLGIRLQPVTDKTPSQSNETSMFENEGGVVLQTHNSNQLKDTESSVQDFNNESESAQNNVFQ